MCRVVLILMLVLLPLRGWTADAMGSAMLMPVNPMPVAAQVEANAHTDCLGHEANEEVTSQGDDACPTCTLCQICHTVALSAPIVTLSGAALTFALPHATLPRYASADAALRIKPPIF
jgi:hypothetical protein